MLASSAIVSSVNAASPAVDRAGERAWARGWPRRGPADPAPTSSSAWRPSRYRVVRSRLNESAPTGYIRLEFASLKLGIGLKNAVNHCPPSTRDAGEFEAGNVGYGPNLDSSPRSPQEGCSKRRRRHNRKYARNVANKGAAAARGSSQVFLSGRVIGKTSGSPAWIRTTIHGSKGRCPTIRRPGIR